MFLSIYYFWLWLRLKPIIRSLEADFLLSPSFLSFGYIFLVSLMFFCIVSYTIKFTDDFFIDFYLSNLYIYFYTFCDESKLNPFSPFLATVTPEFYEKLNFGTTHSFVLSFHSQFFNIFYS